MSAKLHINGGFSLNLHHKFIIVYESKDTDNAGRHCGSPV